ncbi:putative Histone acetyltransferase type B subunit 2 [Blattamonas nauphoetae]|uniref:Histone acetyltransferase type B subunit 2 n=1 Tax=Blattamonas nauphoetae TaxID=2049346 RepID=A0ABQ9XXR6_9EUKA|nr:putative Histone acetyltransferase type B subunit 2 [Blattamonas nauphoetae]
MEDSDIETKPTVRTLQWIRNIPSLYDILITTKTEWPSLTCQFVPGASYDNGDLKCSILSGTQTSGQEPNVLYLTSYNCQKTVETKAERNTTTSPSKPTTDPRITVTSSLTFDGDVNKILFHPKIPSTVSILSSSGVVNMMDYTPNFRPPSLTRTFHGLDGEGFGLSWNKVITNRICAASVTGMVCVWSQDQQNDEPLQSFSSKIPTSCCEWNPEHGNIIACGMDGGVCHLNDLLTSCKTPAITIALQQQSDINSISFNQHPSMSHLLLIGAENGSISLWDTRNTQRALHNFPYHTERITDLSWAPYLPPSLVSSSHAHEGSSIFVSASADCNISLWDCELIGQDSSADSPPKMKPPEQIFVHYGHLAPVNTVGWWPVPFPKKQTDSAPETEPSPYPYIFVSTDSENGCHIWNVKQGTPPFFESQHGGRFIDINEKLGDG